MQRIRFCLGFGRTAKAVAAAFGIVLVIVLGTLAVSPSLHQRLHTDSARPDHFCAISAFATGQLGWTEAIHVVAAASVFHFRGVLLGETLLASHLDFYFSPNRAPPPV